MDIKPVRKKKPIKFGYCGKHKVAHEWRAECVGASPTGEVKLGDNWGLVNGGFIQG